MLLPPAEDLTHMDNDQTRIVNPQAAPRSQAPKAWLLVVHSQDAAQRGQRFPVTQEDVTIGREKDNTIVVPSESASRRHARIFSSGGSHVLVDLESTNGTLLNGKTIAEQTLRNGDVIRVGSTVLRYGIEDEAR
jgi:pSer/pThr/pTyr-binding forkhead associated (FHA) protein